MTYRVDRMVRVVGARLNAAGILAVAWEEPTWVA